jgi:DNA polymerase
MCNACELRNECTSPVSHSYGIYNIAIIGEAPGPQEDKEKVCFIGASGKKVWQSLKPYPRKLFHVSNVNKCYPSKSRKPNREQIDKCSQLYLDKELRELKPILILSFGNTGLQFFKDQKTGIMSMSGKVEWNEKYSAWVVYCLHPAASLHNPDNITYYRAGMKRFKQMLRSLGCPKK